MLQTHKRELIRERPNFARRKFLYRLSRSGYEKDWGKDYVKPGVGTRVLSTLLRYMRKIGPFKGLAFNNPTPQTEDLYNKSINTIVDHTELFSNKYVRAHWCYPTVTLIPDNRLRQRSTR